jgi:signal transduction histidine kinase
MRPRSVLLVDDEAHVLEVLEMRLASMGFAVTAVGNPSDALGLLAERPFDLALFDLRMEPLDGIALTREAHTRQARLPVLIMTAHGTIDAAVEAIKEGAVDFLTKPLLPDELFRKIARAIAERRWARDRNLLRRVGEMLGSTGIVERVLSAVAQGTLEATETERAVVFLLEEGQLVVRASAGASPQSLDALRPAAEAAVGEGAPTKIADGGGRCTIAAPLLVDGHPQGALVAENPGYVVPTEDDLELLAVFASQAAAALKNASELARLRSGALAALGQVAAEVAHELNNPLGGLRLYGQLLRERLAKAGDAKGAEIATRVTRAVDHLAELVQDITTFGQEAELRRQPVGLNTLVEECLTLVEDRVREAGLEVARELAPDAGEMPLDVREVKKVLFNLLLNAIDAMPSGGTLTVRTARGDDGSAELAVEDTGVGMDAETQARMFDLFFTTKPRGTGLGMGIARAAVERHGGRLDIESEVGRGTRVVLRLPAGS